MAARHRLSCLVDDAEHFTVGAVVSDVKHRERPSLPRPRALEPAETGPAPSGRRVRVVPGDRLARLPVFFGELPACTGYTACYLVRWSV